MYRQEFTHGAVQWDAFETKVDVCGSLSLNELNALIDTLKTARDAREDAVDDSKEDEA